MWPAHWMFLKRYALHKSTFYLLTYLLTIYWFHTQFKNHCNYWYTDKLSAIIIHNKLMHNNHSSWLPLGYYRGHWPWAPKFVWVIHNASGSSTKIWLSTGALPGICPLGYATVYVLLPIKPKILVFFKSDELVSKFLWTNVILITKLYRVAQKTGTKTAGCDSYFRQ